MHFQPRPGPCLTATSIWTHVNIGNKTLRLAKKQAVPLKRKCLDILDAEFSRAKELAMITELIGTDFPATMESDGTECRLLTGNDKPSHNVRSREVSTTEPIVVSPAATEPGKCEALDKFTAKTSPTLSESVGRDRRYEALMPPDRTRQTVRDILSQYAAPETLHATVPTPRIDPCFARQPGPECLFFFAEQSCE
ncbi:hypothetical protein LTR49_027080 [Elasticomyces elasticus]|nr:hypothetical protein LTR49_027080 [Elasticomyces elasticus]